MTYLVVENDPERFGIGTDSLPGDCLRSRSAPDGIVIGTGDFDSVGDGQQSEGGDDGFGKHLRVSQRLVHNDVQRSFHTTEGGDSDVH